MKTETIPVVIGAPGLIKKGLEKHTEKIPGAINIIELQKNILIRNRSHTKEGSVLKARFSSACCATGPWFGPFPSEEQQEFKISFDNEDNNNL